MFVRRGLAVVLSSVLGAAALACAPVAWAGDGETAKDVNGCSSAATVKLKVAPGDSDGRLSIVGTVLSDDTDIWSWRMVHNDDVSFRGQVQAADGDRSFKIVRGMIDLAGSDDIVFSAANQSTGEVCRSEVVY